MVAPRAVLQRPSGIQAVPPGGVDRQMERYETGRTCAEPACTTVLSTYNPRSVCWQHERRHPFVHQAPRKPAWAPDERKIFVLGSPGAPPRPIDAGDEEARMPGPEPEPTGPPGPPPVPQPEPTPQPEARAS
jgi:hypothetical protein